MVPGSVGLSAAKAPEAKADAAKATARTDNNPVVFRTVFFLPGMWRGSWRPSPNAFDALQFR
jgi:hypothetical protein